MQRELAGLGVGAGAALVFAQQGGEVVVAQQAAGQAQAVVVAGADHAVVEQAHRADGPQRAGVIGDGKQTWKVRRESVAGRLNKIYNGQPAFKVSEYGCPVLAEGFEGGYAYREIANMPGLYAEEAIKNKYSHIHDALQYLCTRVFLQASQIRTSPDGTEILDDDEDMYYTQEESRGRSTIGGY